MSDLITEFPKEPTVIMIPGMVEQMGYANFYLMTAIIGIPVVLMYARRIKAFDFDTPQAKNAGQIG